VPAIDGLGEEGDISVGSSSQEGTKGTESGTVERGVIVIFSQSLILQLDRIIAPEDAIALLAVDRLVVIDDREVEPRGSLETTLLDSRSASVG